MPQASWAQVAELVGSGTSWPDLFGSAVAVSGVTAVVGMDGPATGRAYVFQEKTSGWHQVAELVGAVNDSFGSAVAVSGKTAVVGAPGYADGMGRAYVFQERASGWHQVAELVGSGTAALDSFGSAVAVSGETAVVGARGSSSVIKVSFGAYLSGSGKRVVAVAPGSVVNRKGTGRAYVFQETAIGWHQVAELVGSGTDVSDNFGWSVADSDGTVVVGALGHPGGPGGAYVFEKGVGGWHQVAQLVGSGTAAPYSFFGCSVAISGLTAIVGAPNANFAAGQAYVFQEGATGWYQVAELVGSGTRAGEQLGSSVAVSGPIAVVGAPGANSTGRAYVWEA